MLHCTQMVYGTVVKPCHCDWSTEDGVIFQNMVLDREFVALVHEVTKDDQDSNETILGLALIDTSNSDDLIIEKIKLDILLSHQLTGSSHDYYCRATSLTHMVEDLPVLHPE
uniref:Uncharacterized protein n=1 Tax=Timema shepardi TaxID=629360 RepID=A0A7R9APM3_TIMSH|nr:unnamed protein product [Timema shepardi]